MSANVARRTFFSDWGFWGFVCGVATLITTVVLSSYIYQGQNSLTLAEFRSQTRLQAEGKSPEDRLPFLEGMLNSEYHEGRFEILKDLYIKFATSKKLADKKRASEETARKALEADRKAKQQADLLVKQKAAEELLAAQAAQAAAAVAATVNLERQKREDEIRQHLDAQQESRRMRFR